MNIPPFSQFPYPSEEAMDSRQRRFYVDLERKLRRGEGPPIDGNISYVFVFVYKVLSTVKARGFQSLHDFLIRLSEIYSNEPKLPGHCRHWANDCLLGLRQYEAYLEKTEPPPPLGVATHPSNLRLNIQNYCGSEANPIDILRMFVSRNSRFIRDNVGLYRDSVKGVFEVVAQAEGPWFKIMGVGPGDKEGGYPHSLFQGAVLPYGLARLEFGLHCFYSSFELEAKVTKLAKDAENDARKIVGVPEVGEGWVSETALFRKLEEQFSQTVVIQHGQPAWLGRQHFDVWFPNWNIAVEYHGEQHFHAVNFFGGAESFAKNVERDERKAALARRHGVKLFAVTKEDEAAALVAKIEAVLAARGPALPPEALRVR